MDKKNDLITNRLGGILRELREEKGFTRDWVSEHSDTGLRHLAAIELGEKNPSVDTLYRLVRCMGISSDRIFYSELYEKNVQIESINRLLVTCSARQQQMVLAFIEMLRDHAEFGS